MFEIIKLVISLFGKLLDPAELKALFKSHHNEDLGAKLFMLYTVLDDIAIDGEALIGKLESYANEMDRRSKSEKDNWSLCGIRGYADISSNTQKQRENLQRLVHHSRKLHTELHLINPKAYRVFTLLVSDSQSGKATLVEKLDRTLQQYKNNRLPLRVPPATKLLKVADELAQVLPTDEDPALGTRPYLLPEPLLIRVGQLNTEFDAGSAAVDTTLWSEETFNEIRSYLENSKPREQLAEIRASAEDLRKSIEAVFPLSDILWKVGSKSFRDEYGYDRSAITRE